MRILLATDARAGADGAARMAAVLSVEGEVTVEVVVVLEHSADYGPGSVGTLDFSSDVEGGARTRAAREKVEESISRASDESQAWPVHVRAGKPPVEIARLAQEVDANLILLGAGRHGRPDRWFGTETALRVMQLSHVPVLAVPQDAAARRPETIVAAVDFSDFSRDAVQAALALASPGAAIHLVHVVRIAPIEALYPVTVEWDESFRDPLRQRLQEWARSLSGLDARAPELHLLTGEVAEEITSLAERLGADLLVAGSHGTGFFGRLLLGSVSSSLIRRAECAVLIAPSREPAREVTDEAVRSKSGYRLDRG
jgi:nucleotide-binding universal stress UspA family protein